MRAMKNSGIEWIGEIPQNWHTTRIKYCMAIDQEKLSEKTDPEYTFQYIDISGVTEYGGIGETTEMTFEKSPSRARMVVKPGDTIISTVRTYLKAVAYIDSLGDHICSTGFCVLSPKKGLFPKFTYYVLQSDYVVQKIVSESVGVSYPAISSTEIGDIKIALPEYVVQARIADYLDAKCAEIDALIATKEKTNALLKERRQSIIYEAVTKGLDPTVPMKDSGVEWIGEIPEGWELKRLKYLGSMQIGLTYSPEEIVADGALVLRSSNIQDGKIVHADDVFVVKEIPEKLKVEEGDILICSRNGSRSLIGKNAVITEEFSGQTFGAFMTIFRGRFNFYIKYLLNSSVFDYYVGSFLTSTINQLTTSNLGNILVPVPSTEEEMWKIAEHIETECRTIDPIIAMNNETIQKLKEYRQSLIYEAVTGKIEV